MADSQLSEIYVVTEILKEKGQKEDGEKEEEAVEGCKKERKDGWSVYLTMCVCVCVCVCVC